MELDERLEATRQHPLLRALGDEALEALLEGAQLLQLRPRRTVLKEGDTAGQVYVLLDGAVRVFHRQERTEYLLKLFRAPALFGEMEVMTARPYVEYVVTLERSVLLSIPAETFTDLLAQNPGFAQAVAFDLAARLCVAAHNIRALAFGDLRARLAHLLLDYAELFGTEVPGGVRLELALSQEMMAKDLAVSRNAINDTLNGFRRLRLVDKQEARYLLRQPERLRALSTGTLTVAYRSSAR